MDYEINGSNAISFDPDFLKSKFKINADELDNLRSFGQKHFHEIEEFIEDFYQWMETQEEFSIFFKSIGTIERVKKQQIIYWQEFFQAIINTSYIKNRIHVGSVHAQIGLPIYSYSSAMNFSSEWWKNKIEESRQNGEFGKNQEKSIKSVVKLSNLFEKLIHLDTTIVTETYHQNTQNKLKKMLEETKKIVHDVTEVAEEVIKGNYSLKLDETSALNSAINKMIEAINLSAIEMERDTWIKTGQTSLIEALRGD